MGELQIRATIGRMFGLVEAIGPEWECYQHSRRVVASWLDSLSGMTDEQRAWFQEGVQRMIAEEPPR